MVVSVHSTLLSTCVANVCMQIVGSEKSSVQPLPLDTPVYDDQVRFVCMSDTHGLAADFANLLPPGDVFLHAGDFTYLGLPQEVEQFNEFLGIVSAVSVAVCLLLGTGTQ